MALFVQTLSAAQVPWSIGQPTDEEQLYLEYINRSRADPPAEGARLAVTTEPKVLGAYSYWPVDLGLMQSQFNVIPAVPPLAMNAQLLAAARLHTGDMYTNQFQGHYSSGTGAGLDVRLAAQGYPMASAAENVFAYAESAWHGHAAFNVDWGPGGVGGMQSPPGHRENIHLPDLREAGIGVVDGYNGSVGPQLVTEDLGSRQGATPLVSGVVYYDFNGNGFYDLGEGIGGVSVLVPGSAYYAVTADSGGYAIPVTTNGTYSITFAAAGFSNQTSALVINSNNVKADYRPTYAPPAISGPAPAFLNQGNAYQFAAVGAATGYDWLQATLVNYTNVEGAETTAGVTLETSAGYTNRSTTYKFAGSYAWRLAHVPDPAPGTDIVRDQLLYLNTVLRAATNSALSFYRRLSYSTADQVARAQVSTNGGLHWTTLWSQPGNGTAGDTNFSAVNLPLGQFAGQLLRVRFLYEYLNGAAYFYNGTNTGVGLYLDNISVTNTEQLAGAATNSTAGLSFTFTPAAATNYLLSVRARINRRQLNWGPGLRLQAVTAPPVIQLGGSPTLANGQVQLPFTVTNFRSGMTFALWKSTNADTGWVADSTAVLTTVAAGSQYRFTTSSGGAQRTFYRVRGLY